VFRAENGQLPELDIFERQIEFAFLKHGFAPRTAQVERRPQRPVQYLTVLRRQGVLWVALHSLPDFADQILRVGR
jgi:hypothetical protein